MGGFHKRKKKRRKEALKQQGEAERRKRLDDRKKVDIRFLNLVLAMLSMALGVLYIVHFLIII